MKLSLTLLALLQFSYALHIGESPRITRSRQLKRTAQDEGSNGLTGILSLDSSNAKNQKTPIPWWKLPNTDNGEMNAISWSQFFPFDNSDADTSETGAIGEENVCPISQCQSSGVLGKHYCGQNARCLRNYCQCNLGWKPTSNLAMSRGWTGLEALTVWVSPYNSGCTERCDTLSCLEVQQVKGCFDQHITQDTKNAGKNDSEGSQEDLATDGLHLGAIKAPGADAGIGA